MAQIGWGALFVFLFCMFSLGLGTHEAPAQWALLALAVVTALVALWAFGVLSNRPTPARPVSPYYERQTLSRLDRLDGVGNRTKDQP